MHEPHCKSFEKLKQTIALPETNRMMLKTVCINLPRQTDVQFWQCISF